MSGILSGSGFEFQTQSIGGTWRWSVISNHIPGYSSSCQVDNIRTPFGILQQTLIPIPDDVIFAISQSIQDIKNQFAPLMHLVSPSSLLFTGVATEGDPALSLGSLVVQNIGAFGSFMDVSATSGSPWIFVDPVTESDIARNDIGTFNLSASPVNLLSASSPYSGTVNLQDNRSPSTTVTATVVLTINPRPVISPSVVNLGFVFYASTYSSTGSQQLVIQNIGPINSTLNTTFAKVGNQPWWTFTPNNVGPLSSGSSGIVTISIVNANSPMNQGTYIDKLRIISPNASNSPIDITITLTVL